MDVEEFRKNAKDTVDYICEYYNKLPERDVYPSVEPGYLAKLLPAEPPEEPEKWEIILQDTEKYITMGITQWQHPQFFAYFPHGASFPSLLGDMISDSYAVVPFSWTASPACSELEVIVLDWLCHALGLPKHFLSSSKGGGVIHSSASEALYNCIIAARSKGIKKLRGNDKTSHDSVFLPQLVAYCSAECHSCVEKGLKLALLKLRILPTDEKFSLRADVLQKAIDEDMAQGLTPIFLCSIFGSTSSTAMDHFEELGLICKKYGIWYHIDGAYSGFSLICPEMRQHIKGIEYADSFMANAHKFFLVHCDCSCLWVKDREEYCSSFIIDPVYLMSGGTTLTYDFRHWGIPLSRKFRSLKLWYVIRTYGLENIRKYQRNHMELAKYFRDKLLQDGNFEVINDVIFGLVCFQIKNSTDKMNQDLLTSLNETKKIHMIPTELKGKYVIRFCVTRENATKNDIDQAIETIKTHSEKIIGTSPRKSSCPCKKSQQEEKSRMSFSIEVSPDVFKEIKEKSKLKDFVTLYITEDKENSEKSTNHVPHSSQ